MRIWSTDGSDVKLKTAVVETGSVAVTGAALDHGADTGNALGTYSTTVYSKIKLESDEGDITIGTANGGTDYTKAGFAAGQIGNANRAQITLGNVNINDVSVDTQTTARSAIEAVDGALATVNSARADLGAAQSRFESVISNVDIAAENTLNARSRVLDADFAKESAELAKTQVLQQAGISVLAQANAMPQQVLALLQ
jgi:flagellin